MAHEAPAGGDRDERPRVAYLVAVTLVSGGLMFGVWIALVGQADLQDNLAGLCVSGAGALFGWLVAARGRAVPQLRAGDLRRLVLLGPQLVAQTVAVYRATWRRARGRGEPGGYRTVPTDAGGGGWRSSRRSAVEAALLSFTPATVVVDIDAETGTAAVHDFVTRGGDG
ncbi:Na+/H+ antiporter subunit E [Acidiferrimicrobium sp. IK]|uniref:Na+/H+ antiporter subunit E n=1 Tax=Acidiferrimicrobium sp. IK TaxID=2871700 RepID=UPI0021CB46E8|nr:Na+/H+ antiporter subunit E [Acidiferrimicrobium sp. IK]MCU4182781.1 Na+/H+ antiporter subunit E [Acidiferrimicrobium sp. IK]